MFSRQTVNMVYKRVCRNCPIPSCGAKYLVRLANHLADVHQLDHIQRRQHLQEAKLQPKVKVVVYESEADNSGKNHYHNPVQTQETVYKLSRYRRNEASFKAKTKRPTAKNKTNRKKQRKSNSWLRGHRKIGQTRKEYLLFLEIDRKKRTCNSQSNDSFSFRFFSNRCVFDSFCHCFF